jgi:hypothetical protein
MNMKKKTLRTIGLLCLAGIAAATFIGYRVYTKPHRSAATETAVATTAAQLVHEYEKDEAASNKKYLGNAVQVSGTVSEVSVNQQNKPVVLLAGSDMSGVQCSLEEPMPGIKKGDSVIIKGFCTGFLTDVIIDRCIAVH